MSSVEAKLAAFRQEKAEKEKKEQRKQRAWDWITLAPIRQRTAAAGGGHQEQQPQQQQQREEVPEQEELEEVRSFCVMLDSPSR